MSRIRLMVCAAGFGLLLSAPAGVLAQAAPQTAAQTPTGVVSHIGNLTGHADAEGRDGQE